MNPLAPAHYAARDSVSSLFDTFLPRLNSWHTTATLLGSFMEDGTFSLSFHTLLEAAPRLLKQVTSETLPEHHRCHIAAFAPSK